MRKLLIPTVAILLALTAGTARADGLLYQLPEDGAWVRFEMEVTTERNGMETAGTGSLIMSSFGRTQVNGEDCRWIEFKWQVKLSEVERTIITKVLIPEKYLKKGEDPLEHLVRGWWKFGDGDPIDVKMARNAYFVPAILGGPLKDVKKLDQEVIESKLGKLECEGLTGYTKYMLLGPREVLVTFETRLHEKAPFGVVSCRMESELKRKGEVVQRWTFTLRLADFGTDAESALPGYQ